MQLHLLPLLLVLAAGLRAASGARTVERSGGRPDPRMLLVGGDTAGDEDRYSYMARIHFLLDDSTGLLAGCGGTLISRSVVLTAAHCTALAQRGGVNVFVRVGAFNPLTDQAEEPDYELRRAVEIVNHPGYVQLGEDQPTSPNDAALVLLDRPVPEEYPIIKLADADTPYPDAGTEVHALGWGGKDPKAVVPAYALQDLKLPVVTRQHCAQQWSYAGAPLTLIKPGHICAGLHLLKNICFGDSGGPLLLRGGSAKTDVQLGIISFSFPTCALPGMPGVFTYIPIYREWIDKEVERLEKKAAAMQEPPPTPPPATAPQQDTDLAAGQAPARQPSAAATGGAGGPAPAPAAEESS